VFSHANDYRSNGPAITTVIDCPAMRIPSSGTPLAHRDQSPQHSHAVTRLDLLMASRPTVGVP
jgi:hypothetical protein